MNSNTGYTLYTNKTSEVKKRNTLLNNIKSSQTTRQSTFTILTEFLQLSYLFVLMRAYDCFEPHVSVNLDTPSI